MTTQEAINAVHKISSNTPHNGYMRSSDTIELVYRILRDHEVQLKAKDKRIAELEKNNTNLINDVIVLDNDLHRFLSIERKKARSIVAMLFWEARKSGSTQRYGFIIKVFKKAYKMLKDIK